MEVDPVRLQKGRVRAGEGGAGGRQVAAENRPQIEGRGEQVARELLPEADTRMAMEAAGRGGAEMGEGREEVAGAGVPVEHSGILAVDAAVEGVDQAVAFASAGMDEEGAGHDPFPFRREHDVDGVVHATGEHWLDAAGIDAGAEDVGGAGLPAGAAGEIVGLLGGGSLAPVDAAIAAEVGAVEIVGTGGECFAVEPDLARFSDAVVVGVGELPDCRRGGDVERAPVPERALRHHQSIGILRPGVEDAVAVGVFESEDPVAGFFRLFDDGDVRAARFGDVEPALLVEVDRHRSLNQRHRGGDLHCETVWDGDRAAGNLEFSGVARRGGSGGQHGRVQNADERRAWAMDGHQRVLPDGCSGGRLSQLRASWKLAATVGAGAYVALATCPIVATRFHLVGRTTISTARR